MKKKKRGSVIPERKEHHELEHNNEKSPMCLGNNRRFIWNARSMVDMVSNDVRLKNGTGHINIFRLYFA